jgi:hypothetical protein
LVYGHDSFRDNYREIHQHFFEGFPQQVDLHAVIVWSHVYGVLRRRMANRSDVAARLRHGVATARDDESLRHGGLALRSEQTSPATSQAIARRDGENSDHHHRYRKTRAC